MALILLQLLFEHLKHFIRKRLISIPCMYQYFVKFRLQQYNVFVTCITIFGVVLEQGCQTAQLLRLVSKIKTGIIVRKLSNDRAIAIPQIQADNGAIKLI